MSALAYLIAYLVPLAATVGVAAGGVWVWMTPVAFFVVLPILDEIVPVDKRNMTAEEEENSKTNSIYTTLIRAWLPVQIAVIAFALFTVATEALTVAEWVGIIASVGIMGGAGINVAHELMHRPKKLDRALAEGIMACVSYTHFCVEHVYGHHRRVATKEDPATARLGDTVFGFVPRSVIGGYKSFLEIEKRLVARKSLGRFSLKDRRIRYAATSVFAYLVIGALLGWSALFFFVAQGIFAFCMLEVVNYLEHYGLERETTASGRYRKVEPIHSWSSPHRLTGLILFGLPRHADHHARASREYPVLRHFDEAPQLPLGYSGMMLVALVPPLWRMVMDPKVHAIRQEMDMPTEPVTPNSYEATA